jgi:hypothetical protein
MANPATAAGRFYQVVPAGGPTTIQQVKGGKGDELDWIWLSAGAGTCTLTDGGATVFTWAGATAERFIPLNLRSQVGAWAITTTGGLTAAASGAFA